MIPCYTRAISECFRGAARQSAIQIHVYYCTFIVQLCYRCYVCIVQAEFGPSHNVQSQQMMVNILHVSLGHHTCQLPVCLTGADPDGGFVGCDRTPLRDKEMF